MKFLALLCLFSCASKQSLIVQKQLLSPSHYASNFVRSGQLSTNEKLDTFCYIVHYNLNSIPKGEQYRMRFIGLTKELKELEFFRDLNDSTGYECFEFSKERDGIFTYRVEIIAKSGQVLDEYTHSHWVRVIKLDEVFE